MAQLSTPLVFPLGGGLGNGAVVGADVWARDLVEVTFDQNMNNNSNLKNPVNYSITATDPSSLVVRVESVRTGKSFSASSILLVVSRFTVGAEYTVVVSSAVTTTAGDSLFISENSAKFIGRNTKIDSAVTSRPAMYDTTITSRLRSILNAIMREDELIGGSRSDDL